MKKIINFCKVCLNHDEKNFNLSDKVRSKPSNFKNGLCQVCQFELKKKKGKIDWSSRQKVLNKICEFAKKNKKGIYDCIIPASGGKDSLRQATIIRDKLGLNPLIVSLSYPPDQITKLGAYNFSNLIENGFDCLKLNLDPIRWKILMKHSFIKFCNWCRSTEMALYASPIHMSLFQEIKVLFYGENFLYTVAHGTKDEGESWDAINLYKGGNTTKGGPASLEYSKASQLDFYFYNYPNMREVKKSKTKIVYLGYFIDDWYGYVNGNLAIKKGFKIRKDKAENTGDLWNFTGVDEDFRIVNQHLKYLKRGYGYVTDQVCEGIHQGLFDRKKAIDLVAKFDGKCGDEYIEKFCKFLSITRNEYENVVEKFVNKNLFYKKNNKWERKFEIF